MILGPRTLMINGKAHKILSFIEGLEGVEVKVRSLDSAIIHSVSLSHHEWHTKKQSARQSYPPLSILRK